MDWSIFWTAAGVIVAASVPLLLWCLDRRKGKSDPEFSVEGADWVIEKDLGFEALLRFLLSLDRAALPGLTDAASGNEFTKAEVFAKSPETWSLIVSRDSLIVGYWSIFSLSDKLIRRLERGVMYDKEITASEIHQISEKREHRLYVEMLGVHPGFAWAQRSIFRMLLKSMREFANDLQSNSVSIEAIYANGFTERGANLCRDFGLVPLVESVQGGHVYRTTNLEGPLQRLNSWSSTRRFSV